MAERLLIYIIGFVAGVVVCRGTSLIDGAKRLVLAIKNKSDRCAKKRT